jgi:hypothetical protein
LNTIKKNETMRDESLAITRGNWNHTKIGSPEIPADELPFEAACWALDWVTSTRAS